MGLKKSPLKRLILRTSFKFKKEFQFSRKKIQKQMFFSRNKYLTYPAKTLAIIYTFLRAYKFAGTLLLSVVSLEERKRERERERA
jgi:hypothetical protein